ncbi:hypothetical protein CKN73_13080 [Carnobacterium divergens]|uniref:hypothetical protein n=1 Tax=Carnobacterium divergens TaxID=2748 RepID=UPI00107225D0|nr:hypothetical protein [Carnobacterium divergens]TFJ41958.1 hypothetical protein CKN77_04485 [Carnobacterium divergens]TFJ47334.1 hypothetical protein CKN73_13080 [Carnobacterium divergens]TFJ51394.1 hypothetical protein CKN83_13050 [Carnobacterium divergens]TFJ61827.1 hypothetical protein CKN89_05490 [Carnobacterium divergens]TFJ68353.1 hypothetical protein CKN91_13030 [Carnobacterium divergens]
MKKRTFEKSLSEKKFEEKEKKQRVELKQIRIGKDAHEYLRNEAFKRNISMKNLLDEIVAEYRKQHD